MQNEILVFGSFTKDTLENHKKEREIAIGGSGAYFSIASSIVGLKAYPVGYISTDIEDNYLKELSKFVDLRYLKKEKKLNFHITYNENFEANYLKDLKEDDEIIDYKDLPIKKYVHVCVISSIKNQIEIIEHFKNNGSFVSTGTYFIRIKSDREKVLKMVYLSDIFFLNRDESLLLSKKDSLNEAVKFFKNLGKRVVITLGKDGAIYIENEKIYKVNSFKTEVKDPTGAGETFAGGFISSYILYNDPVLSLKYGAVLSSFVIEDFGINRLLKINKEDIKRRIESL
jgi:sugar/nucleoside kinase (ribokinase family)